MKEVFKKTSGLQLKGKKMSEAKIIEIQWGGYYFCKEDDDNEEHGIIRLLDFNRYSYQSALFSEKFSEKPEPETVTALSPFIGHVPIDARGILNGTRELIAHKPLAPEDLEGYRMYLEHHEMPTGEIDQLFANLIQYSKEPPLKLKLQIVNEELQIEEV